MITSVQCVALAVALLACSAEDGTMHAPEPIAFQVGAVELAAGREEQRCASYTLDNDEPLYVSAVHMQAGPGIHHSNWFFVSDHRYEGPDGFWSCDERGFDEISGAVGGGVLFAQSTQARSETQSFADGAAVRIPAGSRIVGSVHMLNGSDTAVETSIEMQIETLREEDVTTRLQPMLFDFLSLVIPPQSSTVAGGACDLSGQLGGPIDFEIHYVLPHYHSLGTGATIRAIGGERDGEVLFSGDQTIGEALGQRYDPPLDLGGATGLDFRCQFENPRTEPVHLGYGDQEMCILFAFTDADVRVVSLIQEPPEIEIDGTDARVDGDCRVTSLPPWR